MSKSYKEEARNIVKEMLSQRNYKDIEEEDNITATKDNGDKVVVFFTDIDKFNTECVQFFTKEVNELEIKHCMIVYYNNITSSAKKLIHNIPYVSKVIDSKSKPENIIFELFLYKDLQFNITKHELQPKFELLSKEAATKFKKKYGQKFPKILTIDPISKFYRYTAGQVVKVTRKNGYVTYRIVKKK